MNPVEKTVVGLIGTAVVLCAGAAAYGLWIIKSLMPDPGGK